jgi:putative transposase
MILHALIAMVAGWLQRHQQHVITYLQEENRVLKAHLGGRRLRLTDTERRRLAALAHPLGRKRLTEVATLATPDTLLRWYQRLIAQKFDGSTQRQQLGRPRVAEEVEQLVIRMAEENPSWGYRRIQGALANVAHVIDKITVRNILRRHHLEPAPQHRKAGMSWAQFLKLHWEVLAATDFFTVEVATWHGLVTYYVLFVMELATRRVEVAGITPHPTAAFMQQCARQLTDPFDRFLLGKRYLIHDRDTKFTAAFDSLLKASGVEPIRLPPRSPNLNAHCERFVRSIKEEAINRILMLGERSLYYALQQYLAHYHTERNHQGLGNQLIAPEPEQSHQGGAVVRRDRLGGGLDDRFFGRGVPLSLSWIYGRKIYFFRLFLPRLPALCLDQAKAFLQEVEHTDAMLCRIRLEFTSELLRNLKVHIDSCRRLRLIEIPHCLRHHRWGTFAGLTPLWRGDLRHNYLSSFRPLFNFCT